MRKKKNKRSISILFISPYLPHSCSISISISTYVSFNISIYFYLYLYLYLSINISLDLSLFIYLSQTHIYTHAHVCTRMHTCTRKSVTCFSHQEKYFAGSFSNWLIHGRKLDCYVRLIHTHTFENKGMLFLFIHFNVYFFQYY